MPQSSTMLLPSRNLPPPVIDRSGEVELRANRYGEGFANATIHSRHHLADEGAYFTATNPTVGTPIALFANVVAFSDTNGLFVIKNNDQQGVYGKRLYMDYLRLWLAGTAPTATVSMEFVMKTDVVDRFPTTVANLTALTPTNVNQDSTVGSIAKLASYSAAAAMTLPAASQSARIAGRSHISTSLGITGDEYQLNFGKWDLASPIIGVTAARAGSVGQFIGTANPVVIGPQQTLVVHMWWLTSATTAASFEYELGWWER